MGNSSILTNIYLCFICLRGVLHMIRFNIFKDIEAPENIERINLFIGFAIGLILLGVFNNIPSQQANATIFMIMLITWGFVTEIEQSASKHSRKSLIVYGVGKNFATAIIVGAVFGFALNSAGQSIVPAFAIISTPVLSLLFVGVCAPFIEANFFRGLVLGHTIGFFENLGVKSELVAGSLAIVMQAGMFAWFHTIVIMGTGAFFPSDPWLLLPYFVFGLVSGVGVILFKSIGFEYGLHGVNNLLFLFR